MNKELLLNALQYKHWSDQRILEAVRACAMPVSGHQNTASRFMFQQLHHMILVQELFRARLLHLEDPHLATNTIDLPALSELSERLLNNNDWLLAYAQQLDEQALHQMIPFTFVDGQKARMTRAEILFHLINHGTYHRGAIGHALDLSGGQRPADTFTVFIHAAEPYRRLNH